MEKLATIAPGRLSAVLDAGLRGHHPLFAPQEIRDAFAAADDRVSREDALEVGEALLAICRRPLPVARGHVVALSERARVALIRLYFRLLERAQEGRRSRRLH